MTPNALVAEVLGDYENVDPLDADNADRIARLLNFLRHVYSYCENFREWEWTYEEGFLNAAAPEDTLVAFPANYLELGKQGAIFHPVTGRPIPERTRHFVSRYRRRPGTGGDPYQCFSQSGSYFMFTGALGATAIPIYYRIADLIESELDNDMLMPDKYIRITLLPALVWRIQNMKNDDRAVWAQTMQAGLAQMCVIENPMKGSPSKMPLANRQW